METRREDHEGEGVAQNWTEVVQSVLQRTSQTERTFSCPEPLRLSQEPYDRYLP